MSDLPHAGVLLVAFGAVVVWLTLGVVPYWGWSATIMPWLLAGAAMVALGILALAVSWRSSRQTMRLPVEGRSANRRRDLGIILTLGGAFLLVLSLPGAIASFVCQGWACPAPLWGLEFFGIAGLTLLVPGLVLLVSTRRGSSSPPPV